MKHFVYYPIEMILSQKKKNLRNGCSILYRAKDVLRMVLIFVIFRSDFVFLLAVVLFDLYEPENMSRALLRG